MAKIESINVDETPDVKPRSFELIPAGFYPATITSAELKEARSSTPKALANYISLRCDITGDKFSGRVVFGTITLSSPNETAQRIGKEQLGQLMRALGLARLDDTDQVIGGSLMISVGVKKAEGDYPAKNEIKGFKALEGASLPKPAAPSSKPAASASAPPWAKK